MVTLGFAVVLLLAGILCGDRGLAEGGELKAEQDPEARWDESSQQYQIRLTCGFSTIVDPSRLNASWITPDGQLKPSSGFNDLGHFYLSLLTPVRAGSYTCTISSACPSDDCEEDQGGHAGSANVTVNEMKAKLSLLEANQKALQGDNQRLEEELQNLEQEHGQDMANITAYSHGIKNTIEEKLKDLLEQAKPLRNKLYEWLYKPCDSHHVCIEHVIEQDLPMRDFDTFPKCYKGKCLCPFGYFYSVGLNNCQRRCSRQDLQPTYTLYPASGIHGHNKYTYKNVNATVCKERCSSHDDCQNFEIQGNKVCNLHDVSGVDHDDDAFGWEHYQRNCA